MKSILELEKKVEGLTDEISDIFHATTLNLEALSVQLQSYNESKMTQNMLAQCQKDFENIKYLFKQRANLRLEYLITQQIKQQEAKVRRERLAEYEEKIYDQRRLISDKESFYEGLLKPRKKRPAHMTVEEFHIQRKQQLLMEERKNLKRLQEETVELKKIEKILASDNKQLQKILKQLQDDDIPQSQIQAICLAIQKNPTIYQNIESMGNKRDDKQQIKKLYSNIVELEEKNDNLYKQYKQEKELHQYLQWQYEKLKKQYLLKNQERLMCEIKNKREIQKIGKYKLRRAVSI